ncbi:MAG: CPBP family intramembrane metalloprotease [Gorillibacterium sp.]|nr:CPBP family intramembrane metalloprotease [Gorillibacterium sp.]
MPLFNFNRKLFFLALIGIVLYFTANVWLGSKSEESLDTAVKPTVSMDVAAQTALAWYHAEYGLELAHAEETVYSTDKTMSTYVTKYELNKVFDKTYAQVAPLDFWRVKLKPADEPVIYVRVAMNKAKVVGWEIAQSSKIYLGNLKVAQNVLEQAGFSISDFIIDQPINDTVNPGKVALRFTSKTDKIGEAPLVINMNIMDGHALTMLPHFEPPQDFISWLAKQDKGAGLMATLYIVMALILGLVSLIFVIIKRKQARFSRGILFSLIVFGAIGVYSYNSLPAQVASMPVGSLEFLSLKVLFISNLIIYAILGIALYFTSVSGDQIWRERGWNPWPSFKDTNFGQHVYSSMGRGYLLCFLVMGVQQLLFLFAYNAFDTFAVNDPSQSTFNLYWPWLFPTLAWYAGIGEEITFRLFGIALMRKLLPQGRGVSQHVYRFIAVLAPSLIWAAGHTTYSFYPNYTRLFEVAILGLIFGYIFLRYGLYTAIFTHVSMDIILMSISNMYADSSPRGIFLGLFYIASPFLVGSIILFLHQKLRRKHQELPPPRPVAPY